MEEPRRSPRYRGYRPPPLWWFKLKYLGGMLVFGLFIAFASDQVILALMTGKVPDVSNDTDVVFLWSRTPWRFTWYLFLWTALDLLSLGGFLLLFSKWKGLRGPSAETRL